MSYNRITKGPELIKVMVKILDENKDILVWDHFCYAPKDLYLKFLENRGIERFELAEYLQRWCLLDFNCDLPMTRAQDIIVLRELILDKYEKIFPYLSRPSNTDRQGWTRVWLCEHMEREMRKRND